MPHGGRRPRAGRKQGQASTRSREIADKAAAEGLTPLEYMLDLLRKPYPKNADAATLAAYDAMKMDAAKAAAPFIHSRLAPLDPKVRLESMTGSLAAQGEAVLAALAAGKVTPGQATSLMQVIASHARIVGLDDIEKRLAALEARQGGS